MDNKLFESIVGKKTVNPARDSDKDGVMNMIDCKPYDPNKQGRIHDMVKNLKREQKSFRSYMKPVIKSLKKRPKNVAIKTTRYGNYDDGVPNLGLL